MVNHPNRSKAKREEVKTLPGAMESAARCIRLADAATGLEVPFWHEQALLAIKYAQMTWAKLEADRLFAELDRSANP